MKLLIEVPSWLGDTVMCTPAIENIIKILNKPDITLIGPLSSIKLFENNNHITKTFVLERKNSNLNRFAKNLGRFDIFISFRGSIRSKLLKFFITSNKKYQYNKNIYENLHQVEKYNNFVNNSLGVKLTPGKLKLFKTDVKPKIKGSKLKAGINPGASYGSAKQWHPDRFAEVALKLSKNYEIIIFGGDNEKNISKDIERILLEKGVKNFSNLTGTTSIQGLINKISSLDLFITGDSGPMHIAASFQIPTVTIFGPTNDHETSQWMAEKSVIVKKNLDCQPCMQRTCPLKHHDCMNLIEVNEVLSAINKLN
jgi:heptosyltransferase II